MNDKDFNIIYSYTREQAIKDGVLVDLTKEAQEAGFKIPVAMSAGLYHEYIKPPKALEAQGQSLSGRLNDIFLMLRFAAKDRWDGSRVYFEVLFQMDEGPSFKKVQCVVAVEGDSNGILLLTHGGSEHSRHHGFDSYLHFVTTTPC